MLIKTLAGIALFAAIGAAIGYSRVLCPGGQCQLTGTPYGGAFFGGMLGLAVMSGFGGVKHNADPTRDQTAEDPDEPPKA